MSKVDVTAMVDVTINVETLNIQKSTDCEL